MANFEIGDRVEWYGNGLFPITGIVIRVASKSILVNVEGSGIEKRIAKEKLSWCAYQPN